MCEYFLREETSKIVRVFQSRENFRKSEYFCKHPKLCEDFGSEHFNFFVIKKATKLAIFENEKSEGKKPMPLKWP